MHDYEKYQATMVGLGEVFDKNITDSMLTVYWTTLDGMTDQQFNRACNKALKRCKFFPRPAELINLIEEEDEAAIEAAFDQVRQENRRIGPYGTPELPDEIREVVRRLGGWPKVTEWRTDELRFRRQDFGREYRKVIPPSLAIEDHRPAYIPVAYDG